MRRTSMLKTATLVLAALAVGASASAAPKKDRAVRSASPSTLCHGTPVIMQGLDCSKQSARGEEQEPATGRAKQSRMIAPGSSSVVAAPLPRTPSLTPLPPVAPYVPPAVSNPSERIMQYNQSFPLNGGLGHNPTDRDSYIRYNLTR
jgi:hypothetical protein